MAKLVLSLNGTVLNQRFIDKERIGIGRDSSNDIVVDDPLLGLEHAFVLTVGGDHILENRQGDTGILVNGRATARHILQHHDVVELGGYHLRYLNSRTASDVDLDQTMLIAALPRSGGTAMGGAVAAVAGARMTKVRFPDGSVSVLAGSGRYFVGEDVRLDRVVTTFGIPGEQLVVISRRPQGYFVTHVEGARYPRVNQQSIGLLPHPLRGGDLIEAAGYRLEFKLFPFSESQ